MASKNTRSLKNEERKSAEEIKPLSFKSKIKVPESNTRKSQIDQNKNKSRDSQASTTTKHMREQDTNKKSIGHSGMVIQRVNKSSTIKQFNVASSSKQVNGNKNLTVKKTLGSEISVRKSKEKSESFSGDAVYSKFKTIDRSNINLNPEKKKFPSPSDCLPSDLCHTFLEDVSEEFMMSSAKKTVHKGIKFIPNVKRKSKFSFNLNVKSTATLVKSNDLPTVSESSTPNETDT